MAVNGLLKRRAIPWVIWTAITAVGALVGYFVLAGASLGSSFYDPDEVEAFLQTTPTSRLLQALVAGAMTGVVLGLFVGGIRWLLSRNVRDALKAAVLALSTTVLLCLVAGTGGPSSLENPTVDALRYGFAGGLVGGALAGLGQWLFLRLWAGGDADGWGTATPLLWAVTWALAFALLDLDEDTSALRWVLSGLLVLSLGAVIGAGQWFVLRRIAPRAGWWVIACASSALLTMVVMAHTRSGWALVTGGIALGGGTGAALLWLLPERQAVAETG